VHALVNGQDGIERTRAAWRAERPQPRLPRLGLFEPFKEDHALAIYIYSLEEPAVSSVISRSMRDENVGAEHARENQRGEVSAELRACIPCDAARAEPAQLSQLPRAGPAELSGDWHFASLPPRRPAERLPRLAGTSSS
jgi:hypothetical protein